MAGATWNLAAAVLAVTTPLVAVPLTMITFYLKGLRDQQAGRYGDLARRVELIESGLQRVCRELVEMRRDYATKEEWLRESMWVRGRIDRLSAEATRAESVVEQWAGLSAEVTRTARQVAALAGAGDEGKEAR